MNNYPTRGIDHFIWEEMKKETDGTRLIDMAQWRAREAGMTGTGVTHYAFGMVSSMLGFANRLNTKG